MDRNGQKMDIFYDSVRFLSIICPSVHFPFICPFSSWTENGQNVIPRGQKMDTKSTNFHSSWIENGQVGWTENVQIMDRSYEQEMDRMRTKTDIMYKDVNKEMLNRLGFQIRVIDLKITDQGFILG